MPKKLLFVLNPMAGRKSKRKAEIYGLLELFCKENDFAYSIYLTTGTNDAAILQRTCIEYGPDAVIAVGGDGTINMAGDILMNSNIPLGIIPMGSANGLAKDLNISDNPEEALSLIKDFYIHAIDCLKVNDKTCVHVSDLGFNAQIVRRFSESITRGKISYIWYGLIEFFTFKPFYYVIETEDQVLRGEAFMLTITNGNKFGTNANINPLGQIDDGYFEICIIKPFPVTSSLKILRRLFNNSIHQSKYSRIIHCKKATIHHQTNTSFHIDGEPNPVSKKTEVNIIPKGLRIIIPCCR